VTALNPQRLLQAPGAARHFRPAVVAEVRDSLSVALHWVFVGVLPLIAVAIVAVLFLREAPLRTSSHVGGRAELDGERVSA
jgi:hypothetical protein